MSDIEINTTTRNITLKTHVWHYAESLLTENKIKKEGNNQYLLFNWLMDKNKHVIENAFIQQNSTVVIPKDPIDIYKIFCVKLSVNISDTAYYDLLVCDHEIDGAIEVAKYIVEEIKTNIKSDAANEIKQILKEYKAVKQYEKTIPANIWDAGSSSIFLEACLKWKDKVDTGNDWDHKEKIREKFAHCSVHRPLKSKTFSETYYHKYQYHDYFIDVWSNIHYGFVGRYCGFSEDILLLGSDVQQFGSNLVHGKFFRGDDPADKISMKLGCDLYAKYGNNLRLLTYQVVLDDLERLRSVGDSRLIHYCYDREGDRFHPV